MSESYTTGETLLAELRAAPSFAVIKEIPPGTAPEIENAVRDFIVSSKLSGDLDVQGFFYQTLSSMANATYLNGGGDLWLGFLDGHLVTYILAGISKDIDHKLCYWVSQAWVRKDQRGKPWVRDAWQKLRQRAKDCFCGHIVVVSSRGNDLAYCRFLGKGFKPYASLLKEVI